MITEEKILEWQRTPDDALLEAVRSGEVLLITRERQAQIVQRIHELNHESKDKAQQLADIQLRFAVLTGAVFSLLKSCEGIAAHVPEAIELFYNLKVANNKGEINWSALMGIAGDFVMNNAKAKQIKSLFEKFKSGFDQQHFATIPLEQVMGILREQHMDLNAYENTLAFIISSTFKKEATGG